LGREWVPALSEYLVVRHCVVRLHNRPLPTYPVQIC